MANVEPDRTDNGSPFWQFSLAFYQRSQVQEACLTSQDQSGADVNMILYLLFAATSECALTRQSVVDLDAFVAPWRDEVVGPLRSIRRALKTIDFPPIDAVMALRTRVKSDELESERLQQEAMFVFAQTLHSRNCSATKAAKENLDHYDNCLKNKIPSEVLEKIHNEFSAFLTAG